MLIKPLLVYPTELNKKITSTLGAHRFGQKGSWPILVWKGYLDPQKLQSAFSSVNEALSTRLRHLSSTQISLTRQHKQSCVLKGSVNQQGQIVDGLLHKNS